MVCVRKYGSLWINYKWFGVVSAGGFDDILSFVVGWKVINQVLQKQTDEIPQLKNVPNFILNVFQL